MVGYGRFGNDGNSKIAVDFTNRQAAVDFCIARESKGERVRLFAIELSNGLVYGHTCCAYTSPV